MLKELVRQLKGNDSLQLEILKTLGCHFPHQKSSKKGGKKAKTKIKSKSKVKSKSKAKAKVFDLKNVRPKKSKLEKLRNLNKLISKDKEQVSKLKNELEKSSLKGSKIQPVSRKKSKQKRSRVKLTLQPSLIPPSVLVNPKNFGPSTEHEMKSIGFISEPFSLQNHQVFQCKGPSNIKYKGTAPTQGLDLTSLRLGSKAFNKKGQMNTVYVLPEKRRSGFKSKENIPSKLRTAKKSRRQNFHLKSPMLMRVGSASTLKPKLMGTRNQKKSHQHRSNYATW